ncbi:MAG: flagellar biosynthetic protein FliO [Parachlamydiaceae bacterium]|nr:flagellar biosynthetic protein FliO [Parachlamydiaceae bacterium]
MRKNLFTYLMCLNFLFFSFSIHGQENVESKNTESSQLEQSQVKNKSTPTEKNQPIDLFEHTEKDPQSFQSKFLNMLFMLGLLIGLMILASWIIKRLMRSREVKQNMQSSIKVLETRQLSPKATIYLLDVMGQGIVVAESPAGVHQISKVQLDDSEWNKTQ